MNNLVICAVVVIVFVCSIINYMIVILKPYMRLLDNDGKMNQTASIMFSLFSSLSESERIKNMWIVVGICTVVIVSMYKLICKVTSNLE